MAYYDFPHTRNYDTDLGYLIKQYLELRDEVELLISTQTITYADPLQWDITTQYKVNTIVINGYNAYLSKQEVPKGILITNTDYWLTVGDFIKEFEDLRNNIADANNGVSPTLLVTRKQGDLLWWNDTLYQCLTNIEAGTALIVDTNIKQITIEDYVLGKQTQIETYVNNAISAEAQARTDAISNLSTEVQTEISDLSTKLQTEIDNRQLADTELTNKINSETTARVTGDENTLAEAKAYTDNHIEKKKYIFLGDSYNFYAGGWLSGVVAGLGLTSSDYYDITASGHGFYSTGADDHKWITDITNWATAQTTEVLNSITDVICVGGLNDSYANAWVNVLTEMTTFINYVKSTMPNAKVSVAYVGSALENSSVIEDRTRWNRLNAIKQYQKISTIGGFYLSGCENSLNMYTLFDNDGLHPNSYGITNIVQTVTNAIKTGYGTINSSLYSDNVAFGDLTVLHLEQSLDNNYEIIKLNTAYTSIAVTISGTYKDFGDCYYLLPNMLDPIFVPATIGDVQTIIELKVENRHLYIANRSVTNGNYAQLTGQLRFSATFEQLIILSM